MNIGKKRISEKDIKKRIKLMKDIELNQQLENIRSANTSEEAMKQYIEYLSEKEKYKAMYPSKREKIKSAIKGISNKLAERIAQNIKQRASQTITPRPSTPRPHARVQTPPMRNIEPVSGFGFNIRSLGREMKTRQAPMSHLRNFFFETRTQSFSKLRPYSFSSLIYGQKRTTRRK